LLVLWFLGSLDALVLRFEAPDSRNRWDSPLFTIQQEDTLPFDGISDAVFKRKAPPQNQSTLSVSHTGPLGMYVHWGLHLNGLFIQKQTQHEYMGVYWLVFFCSNRCPLLTSYTSWTR
jgi:tRNA uridine 5-carbamoylmethylation protein Kti12